MPPSAVLRKAPGSSETGSDRKGQEAQSPDLGGPRYLVALGVVLYPKLRHAGVHTRGQCGVWIAKTKKQTMVTETFVVPAHSEKQTWERGWRRVPMALPFGLSPRVIPWLTVIPGGM